MKKIIETGSYRDDRTGVGIYALFDESLKFDLREGFPLVTTRKLYWRGIVNEFCVLMKGETNVLNFPDTIQKWWAPFADDTGYLGPIYGAQYRHWGRVPDEEESVVVDQIEKMKQSISIQPYSRRHIMSNWNVADIDKMRLPCCHGLLVQCFCEDNFLDCKVVCRSSDVILGLPVNIAFWALFLMLMAKETNRRPRYLSMSLGDCHLYKNHVEGAQMQVKRDPLHLSQVTLHPDITFNNLIPIGFMLQGYRFNNFPVLKFPMAVGPEFERE